MTSQKTLKVLFDSRKEELAKKLMDFSLPKDATTIQTTVAGYLNELFDSEGDFRQNLTQSEDYVVQAAMSLLNAQQSMLGEFNKAVIQPLKEQETKDNQSEQKVINNKIDSRKKDNPAYIVGGTAAGGAAGALFLGAWGAVFGAIAGTALVLYYTSISEQAHSKSNIKSTVTQPVTAKQLEQKIDVERFTAIVGNICDSVDSLILTFRTQINRVVDKYENQEKPVFEKEYGVLLDSIQSLLGACYQPIDEKRQKRIDSRIDQLAESLENYNLEVVRYSDNNKSLFEMQVSEKVAETTMVLPAIVKQGVLVRKGKVFTKE